MKTLTPKIECRKHKSGEITRFLECMDALDLRVQDVAKLAGVAERTIKNLIWNDSPLSGDVLRGLHLEKGVSIDWLVSGTGSMLGDDEPRQVFGRSSDRAARIAAFVLDWAATHTPDELVWLDVNIQRSVPEYAAWLARGNPNG